MELHHVNKSKTYLKVCGLGKVNHPQGFWNS